MNRRAIDVLSADNMRMSQKRLRGACGRGSTIAPEACTKNSQIKAVTKSMPKSLASKMWKLVLPCITTTTYRFMVYTF